MLATTICSILAAANPVALAQSESQLPPPLLPGRFVEQAGTPRAFALGDMDGDGHVDLVVVAQAYGSSAHAGVCFGKGNGEFGAGTSNPITATGDLQPWNLRLADFDGDGDLDAAFVQSHQESSQVIVLRNEGAGVLTQGVGLLLAPHMRALATCDLNGDQLADLVVFKSVNSVATSLSTGSSFMPLVTLPPPTNPSLSAFVPHSLELHDLDGNGTPDITVMQGIVLQRAVAYFNDGSGKMSDPVVLRMLPRYTIDLALADLRGDGLLQLGTQRILPSGRSEFEWFENDGFGHFTGEGETIQSDQFSNWMTNFPGTDPLIVYDLDGDGREEWLAKSANWGRERILFEHGVVGLSDTNPRYPGYSTVDAIADVDEDGFPDFLCGATPDSWGNPPQLFFGAEGGSSRGVVTSPLIDQGQGERGLLDFDADGKLDLLITRIDYDKCHWYRGLGDGSFQFQSQITLQMPSHSFHSADFNGDGHLDVAFVQGVLHKQVEFLLGDGQGGFVSAGDVEISLAQPHLFPRPAILDGDGDGRAELVLIDAGADRLLWLGLSKSGSATTLTTHVLRGVIGLKDGEDLDGDGADELLVFAPGSNTVLSVWSVAHALSGLPPILTERLGLPLTEVPYGPNASSSDDIQLVDFDGDGLLDVLSTVTSPYQFPYLPVESFVEIWISQPGGGYSRQFAARLNLFILSLQVHHLDGDARMDISMHAINGLGHPSLMVWRSPTGVPLRRAERYGGALSGDLNGDGAVDFLSSTKWSLITLLNLSVP
jgi:hypothetical protein